MLGEGAFGKVRLARSDATGHVVAVKVIKRDRINARAEELLRREVISRLYLPYISPISPPHLPYISAGLLQVVSGTLHSPHAPPAVQVR